MNRTGQTIDARYLVERRLGTGGMADVFACEDLQLGRHVAVKVLHEQLAEDPQVVARFRRESQSAAGLQHPHIVSVFDRGDWDGIPYMAMELVDGVTLKDVIRDQAPLDPVKSIDQISQVLDALRYAHRRGLVHRDIKPQNILVGPDGDLKVADFGIARAIDDLQMTQTGMIVGTAHYLSPEQASGQAITPSADLYAVGVVLFEMLTGRMPFEGDQPVAIALKHVNEEPPALSVVNPDVPADLEYVVMRALAKVPEERYADAEEFIAALQAVRHRIVSGAPVPEHGPFSTGAPGGYGAGGAQITGGWLQPAAGMAVPAGVAPEEVREQAEARRRRNWTFAIVGGLATLMVLALIGYLAFGRMETVPDVRGLSAAKATQRLEDRGFKVIRDEAASSKVPADTVMRQDPSALRRVRHGGRVRIVVSTGQAEAVVPTVSGLTLDQAKQKLGEAGFTRVNDTRMSSATVATDTVITTDPGPDASVPTSTTITVRVSSGPASNGKTTVPDVEGMTRTKAAATLKGAGLGASFTEQDSRDNKAGTVLSQSPTAKSEVDPGSVVAVVIARAVKEQTTTTPTQTTTTPSTDVTVPNVQGKTRSQAESALKKLGLRPQVSTVTVADEAQDGKIIEQVPNGGRVAAGARVNLKVGRYQAPATTTEGASGDGSPTASGGAGDRTPASTNPVSDTRTLRVTEGAS